MLEAELLVESLKAEVVYILKEQIKGIDWRTVYPLDSDLSTAKNYLIIIKPHE